MIHHTGSSTVTVAKNVAPLGGAEAEVISSLTSYLAKRVLTTYSTSQRCHFNVAVQ